jgi:hypothetical protein
MGYGENIGPDILAVTGKINARAPSKEETEREALPDYIASHPGRRSFS